MNSANTIQMEKLKSNSAKWGNITKPKSFYNVNANVNLVSARKPIEPIEYNNNLAYSIEEERMQNNVMLELTAHKIIGNRFQNIEDYNNKIKRILINIGDTLILTKRESMLMKVVSVLLGMLGAFFLVLSISFFLLTSYSYLAIGSLGPASGAFCASIYIYYKLRTSLTQ
jgi:hypothetical protein